MLLDRRQFLISGAAAAATLILTSPVEAALRRLPERSLSLYNTHTGETVRTVYWAEGRYRASALAAYSRLLRDHRTGEVHDIDPKVLDLMCGMQARLRLKQPWHIISGYRSPRTNALMAEASDGVARHSLHMEGKAIDIRVPGMSTRTVARCAKGFKVGGVGQYARDNFVHIDVGRVRYW